MPTRCSWPPDSSRGLCLARSLKPTRLKRSADALAALRRRQRREQQRQLDVALGRQHRQQVVHLEHEADVIRAPLAERAVAERVGALAGDLDRAGARPVQAADQVQQRRLARARRPHQREEIPFRDVQVELRAARAPSRRRACSPWPRPAVVPDVSTISPRPVFSRSLLLTFAPSLSPSTGAATTTSPGVDARQHFDLAVALAAGAHRDAFDLAVLDAPDEARVAVADDGRGRHAHRGPRRSGLRACSARGLRENSPSRPCPAGCADRACRSRCARAPSPSGGPLSARC